MKRPSDSARGATAPAVEQRYVIPLRQTVMFPDMVVPIVLNRPASLTALDAALAADKIILALSQKAAEDDHPGPENVYHTGCLCKVLQTMRTADGTAKLLLEGVGRARVSAFVQGSQPWSATIERLDYQVLLPTDGGEAVVRAALSLFEEYIDKNPKLPDDVFQAVSAIQDPVRMYHLIVGHSTLKTADKIELLEHTSLHRAYLDLCRILAREVELLNIENRIYGEVRQQIDDQQRSYFLHEQMKVIERELGKRGYDEGREYERKIARAKMPEAVQAIAKTELAKFDKLPPFSPEGTVIRNYLDWLVALPWVKATKDNLDLAHARAVLEKTHYGLKDPKERVLEFLAVRKLRLENRRRRVREVKEPGTVLCLVGPPGVGKTSLAQSVANALGRKFVRIALGGVRDEAEIRGHRRTYIGALPGRIVQALKKAGTNNPVMLLDEIDKMYSDLRGDPAAALLEVLDPEQNHTFNDHYLEVDLDLSKIMFICTANVQDAIHPTLRDRMETIDLCSYTEDEKRHIAQAFLLRKQRLLAGITCPVTLDDATLTTIIRDYTREAGVRQLERALAQIMRKLALALVAQLRRPRRIALTAADVRQHLGTPKHRLDLELPPVAPGVALGLAWTETGGDIIKVEATAVEGKGELILTGQLGDVMQESARAAVTFVRRRRHELKLPASFFAKHDLHIHVPEGAIPKDGPSAGITIAAALYSLLGNRPLRAKLALTGEITLGGVVLGVGGVKEKLLAAHRAGVRDVIVPRRSMAELDDVPPDVRAALHIQLVDSMDDVVRAAFRAVRARPARRV